ncbi:MAG: hypothetical protein ACLFVQ_13940 [Chitinispirillaceae bacterium]
MIHVKHFLYPDFSSVMMHLTGLLFCFLLSCDNHLIPPTGLPEITFSPQATPQGTIEQLIRSYEDRRIDLFTDLLPDNKTFRFFVSPDYSAAYAASKGPDAMIESVDSQYHYVKAGNYYYWGHEIEIAKHRNLFSMAEDIEFVEQPIIDPKDFRYKVNEQGETTHVEVKMTSGELCIGLSHEIFCTDKEGQMQVFLLERETDRATDEKLWVIRDWFDLNSIQ